MNKKLDVSIIVINFNTARLTANCIKSILQFTKDTNFEIILIDNGSEASDLRLLKSLIGKNPKIRTEFNSKNLGFSGANNQGLAKANGEALLLLNSDTILSSDVISQSVSWLRKHSDCGIMSCQLYNQDGTVQGTGGYFPTLPTIFYWMLMIEDIPGSARFLKSYHPIHKRGIYKGLVTVQEQQLDWLTGAFLLIRKEVYEQIGGMDLDYFMYVEDVDYCYRAKKSGWQVWLAPQFGITHLGGASSSNEYPLISEFKNVLLFYKKHYAKWQEIFARLLFKVGSVLRAIIFGILGDRESSKTYAKAFKQI